MPPRAITRAAWTTEERIGAALVVWTAVITLVAIGCIVWAVVT